MKSDNRGRSQWGDREKEKDLGGEQDNGIELERFVSECEVVRFYAIIFDLVTLLFKTADLISDKR